MRVSTFNERAAALFQVGAEQAKAAGGSIRLGNYQIEISGLRSDKPVPFTDLLKLGPRRSLTLHFLTPTAFKRGPRRLHLPIPANVFDRPVTIWQLYAPPAIQLPSDWPDWCEANVFAQRHSIHTAQQAVNARGTFIGFVGKVKFVAIDDNDAYLRLWHSLGRLASYCGVGSKTTMGMGAVAWRSKPKKGDRKTE